MTAAATAAAVRAGLSAVGFHPFMVDRSGESMKVGRVKPIDPAVFGVDRLEALLRPAIEEAITPILVSHARLAIPLILGLPEVRPGFRREDVALLASRIRKAGAFTVSPAPVTALAYGHASGLMALEEAAKVVQSGRVEFALAGGVDSFLEPDTLEWLDANQQLISPINRSAFPPGEGAGVLLLTTSSTARRRKLPVLGWHVASGTALEKNRIKTETICLGQGLTDALRKVIAALKLPEERINFAYGDLNGERYRNEEYLYALMRTQAALVKNQNFAAPAECLGDCGAASGPVFASLALESGKRGYALGPRALMWAGSEGGQRAAAILHLNLPELKP
jgi:3-oxoacyl-[acyl-carrier-protein] synthase-1